MITLCMLWLVIETIMFLFCWFSWTLFSSNPTYSPAVKNSWGWVIVWWKFIFWMLGTRGKFQITKPNSTWGNKQGNCDAGSFFSLCVCFNVCSLHQSLSQPVSQSVSPSVRLSVHPSDSPSLFNDVHLSVCPFLNLSFVSQLQCH